MSTSNLNAPGYLLTQLTPTALGRVQPIRLVHLDPEGSGAEGFDSTTTAFQETQMAVDGASGLYRYTLASTGGDIRRRVRGLVAGMSVNKGPLPLWIAIDAPDLEAVLETQGNYLGNIADNHGVLHRLERYDGSALTAMIDAMLSDHPALTVLPRPQSPPAGTALPVFITTLEATTHCLFEPVELPMTAPMWRWLSLNMRRIKITKELVDTPVVRYHQDGQTYGFIHDSSATTDLLAEENHQNPLGAKPTTVTWIPDITLLRKFATASRRGLECPAMLLMYPAPGILYAAWH